MVGGKASWLSGLAHIPRTGRIPKIIHQTFPTHALPAHLDRNVESLKATNPGWEHRLYDEADCERLIGDRYGPRVLDLYRRINPEYGAARADLFRYLAVYALGGVYLDIKSYFDRPIDGVIDEQDAFIISYWDNAPGGAFPGFGVHADLDISPRGEIQQWHVIAEPGHPFLREVIATVLDNIERYRPWKNGVGRIGVLRTTGPIAYTRAIAPLLDQYPHRLVGNPAEIGLRYSIEDGYEHQTVFKRHYSTHTTPVVRLPAWAVPPAKLYGYLKRRQLQAAQRTIR